MAPAGPEIREEELGELCTHFPAFSPSHSLFPTHPHPLSVHRPSPSPSNQPSLYTDYPCGSHNTPPQALRVPHAQCWTLWQADSPHCPVMPALTCWRVMVTGQAAVFTAGNLTAFTLDHGLLAFPIPEPNFYQK